MAIPFISDQQPPYLRYGLALLVTLASLFLLPLWGEQSSLLVFVPAVMVSSWYGGLGPGITATIVGSVLGIWGVLGWPLTWSHEAIAVANLAHLTLFIVTGGLISGLNFRSQQAANRLRGLNDTLQAIIQTSPLAIMTLDRAGRIGFWSPAAEQIFGWKAEEVEGEPAPLAPADQQAAFQANLKEAFEGKFLAGTEVRRQRKDGTSIVINGWSAPLRDADGVVRKVVAIMADVTERKRVEVALRNVNQTLQAIIQASPLGILTITPDDRVSLWSPGAEQIFGWSEQEVLGQPVPFIPPDQQPIYQADLRRASRGECLKAFETVRQRKDGTPIAIEVWSAPLRNADGEITEILAMTADISERKQTEAALIEVYQRNTEILESISDAFYAVDYDWRFTYINRKAEQLWQKRRAALLGQNIWSEFPEAVGSESYEAHLKAAQEQVTVAYETRSTVLGVWLKVNIYPSHDGLSVYFEDISDRKRAERALQRYAQRLETLRAIDELILLAETTADPVQLALNRICGLIPCHQAFILLFDFQADEAYMLTGVEQGNPLDVTSTTLPISNFVSVNQLKQESLRYVDDVYDLDCTPGIQALMGPQMRSCLTVPLMAEDTLLGVLNLGTTQRASFQKEHFEIAQEVANQLAIAIQQSQLRDQLQAYAAELEERVVDRTAKLREANLELESFAYSVSHDLRSPLQAMQGLAQALLEDYAAQLDDLGQEYAKRICQSALRMDTLIENLLTYSRLNRSEIQLRAIPLEPVIQEALQLLEEQIQASQAQIQVQVPLPSVLGHRSTLLQVVMNLVANSLKFVPAGVLPEIEMGAEERGAWVRLWVQDNGIGIREDQKERIFEVFERLHSLDAYSGTGIGLAIVQRGVQRMGGQVAVDSQPGKGSRFWIQLPSPNRPPLPEMND